MEIVFLPHIQNEKLKTLYGRAFKNATELYIMSAYLTHWDNEYPLNENCKIFRMIVGKDFGITRKSACERVIRWIPKRHAAQFLVAEDIVGFHPKAMFWREKSGKYFALVGSSNLSIAAFSRNHEVNLFSEIEASIFNEAKEWTRKMEASCVPVSESWLEEYVEAQTQTGKAKNNLPDDKAPLFSLILPKLKDKRYLQNILAKRRSQIEIFEIKKPQLESLFRTTALKKGRWGRKNNDEFFKNMTALWARYNSAAAPGEQGCRFQRNGFERSGKGSDFQEFSRSMVRVLDANDFERDGFVSEEIDRLSELKVATRKALFSEMLCQFFPFEFHVWNAPVVSWLADTGFKPPRGATEGNKYIDMARKLRVALNRAPEYPAKNLAELDIIMVSLADKSP